MLKKLILLLLVVAPLSIFAQEKLAHVGYQEVFMKMPELKDVETKLAAKSESIKKNLAAIEAEFTKKQEEFRNSPEQPTEALILDRQKQLDQLKERYESYMQAGQAEYEKEQQTLITPLQQKLRQAIKEVGDENNYTYILDSGSLLYIGSRSVDANKAVKTKLGIVD